MTITVDPEAVRALATRLEAEALDTRTRSARISEPDAGGVTVLVRLLLDSCTDAAGDVALCLDTDAEGLRTVVRYDELVDLAVAERVLDLERGLWSS